ncbi:hypothetical protein [Kordia sp.]|uniref:hypothetical protein n=1 Tax=Kordia sp. TaxID=1965332 RepID=UPI003B5B6458
MKKSILAIKGVSELDKKTQSKITGAGIPCWTGGSCRETGWYCNEIYCKGLWGPRVEDRD